MQTYSRGLTSSKSLLIVIVAITALAVGVYLSPNERGAPFDPNDFNGTILSQPRAISQFDLVNDENQPFTNDNLKGKWTMMFFGFTHCPHICPMTMTHLKETYEQLQQTNAQALPQVVLVSVDPERDTVERMHTYVKSFNPSFIGATGEADAIAAMTKEIGVAYIKLSDPNGSDDYDIEHTGAIMLFNPDGNLAGFFTTPHEPEKIAADFKKLIA